MSKPLKQQESEVGLKDFQNFAFEKLGLDRSLTRRVLQTLAEFTALNLRSGTVVRLPGIGKISAQKKARVRLSLRASSRLLLSIDNRAELRLNSYEKEVLVKQNKVEQSRRIYKELSGKTLTSKVKNPDLIKISFLRYLQRDFIWGKPWQHPYTKQPYNFDLIKEKLLLLKDLNPKAYKTLFILWVSLDKRKSRLRYFGLSSHSINGLWDKAADTMMLMLLQPDLPPSIVETLTTTHGRQPRRTDSATSSECYGIHRADGVTGNGVGRPDKRVPTRRQIRTSNAYWSSEESL